MLELRHISKAFPGVRALDDVSLEFKAGEVHALMGENGAGKSTAIKILTGIHQPDTGEIRLEGQTLRLRDFQDATAQGIGIVHQEIQIIPDASVAENIMIGRLVANRWGVVDWDATCAEAETLMRRVGLNLSPDVLGRELSAAQKQLVQIAKALSANVRVLLLDEPTSSLTEHEAKRLFELVRELRSAGVALVFVSHKLEEVFDLCDRVTVLRDGRHVGTRPIQDVSRAELVSMMMGRTCIDDHLGQLSPDWQQPVLRVENLCRAGKVADANFTLYRGEILGFYGLVGAGRTELARVLIGEDSADSGSMFIRGERVQVRSVEESVYRHRLGYVTENRKEEGVFLHDSVQTNLTLGVWPRLRNRWTRAIDGEGERRIAAEHVAAMSIKTPTLDQPVGMLSGGNQQKVSIGKWLAAECEILIVDEPTVGVDVGAKQQIHRLLWELAAHQRKSLIVISSDLPELVRLANRLLIFREHRIVGEVRDIDTKAKTYADVSAEIAPYFL